MSGEFAILNPGEVVAEQPIEKRIYTIRNLQVILDQDLAKLYGVETRRLNEQVKRNISRFPEDFMFQLTSEEFIFLKSHFATSSWGGRRKLPYAFTELGVSMLSSVLTSEVAIQANVQIMRAFAAMRRFLVSNAQVFQRLENLEYKLIATDQKVEKLYDKLQLDLARHNAQYAQIDIKPFNKAHDRFIIIDDNVYHIGASLKDLGKKWFAFSLMRDIMPQDLTSKV